MAQKIRVAIAGIGNCASALVQGISYYSNHEQNSYHGIMAEDIGGYSISDIEIAAAFDVDKRKVGLPLSEAIFMKPNCCMNIHSEGLPEDVIVKMGEPLDGIAPHMQKWPEDKAFRISIEKPIDIVSELKRTETQVLVCFLPVGAEKAVRHYAEACLSSNVAMVNCVPVFIASNIEWSERFRLAKLPIIGDDIKSQVGATIVHRNLARLLFERGYNISRTYQLNTGGNTDFLNMYDRERLASKKKSKTQAVRSQIEQEINRDNIHIGPSDYVPWQLDNKNAFIRLEGTGFANAPLELELRLSVQDSPNSAGVVVDAIRCAKVAFDRGIGGAIDAPSAYYMKSPPKQFTDQKSLEKLNSFLEDYKPTCVD